ncbi:MAG TPA: DUF5666 domain-containing protein [Vicinamibacterales bacterium]|jgi:hypothetical protein|nr:DUF5666 domain-containing protein [Vicinamibacterales bacterium]
MRRVSLVVPVLAVVLGWSGGTMAHAQATKTARGTVTAMAGDSVTVKVKNQDMKFAVDEKTEVIAPGGGHKEAAAKREGASGAKLGDVIKAGQSVEVSYHDMGGGMLHAASIRAIASAGEGSMSSDKPAAMHANGKVKSVTGDSLVIDASGKDMTFAVDAQTRFTGTGLGRKASASGGKLAVTDAVAMGDSVTVTYHDMGGSMHAAEVRVTAKAKK